MSATSCRAPACGAGSPPPPAGPEHPGPKSGSSASDKARSRRVTVRLWRVNRFENDARFCGRVWQLAGRSVEVGDLAAVGGAHGTPGGEIDRIPHEPDAPVGHADVHAAAVVAAGGQVG